MWNNNYVIAIDGKAATGKSCLAKSLAEKLNILYIDTGAMYRAAGLYFLNNKLEINEENVKKYIYKLDISLKYENAQTKVFLNSEEITSKIRNTEVAFAASTISKYKLIREKLVALQRKMAGEESVVLEGRDITTVVFPKATLKIYLDASADIRALRRKRDLEKIGEIVELEAVKKDLEKRDVQDTNREESPLRIAEDAIVIDTTTLTNDKTVDIVIALLNERI